MLIHPTAIHLLSVILVLTMTGACSTAIKKPTPKPNFNIGGPDKLGKDQLLNTPGICRDLLGPHLACADSRRSRKDECKEGKDALVWARTLDLSGEPTATTSWHTAAQASTATFRDIDVQPHSGDLGVVGIFGEAGLVANLSSQGVLRHASYLLAGNEEKGSHRPLAIRWRPAGRMFVVGERCDPARQLRRPSCSIETLLFSEKGTVDRAAKIHVHALTSIQATGSNPDGSIWLVGRLKMKDAGSRFWIALTKTVGSPDVERIVAGPPRTHISGIVGTGGGGFAIVGFTLPPRTRTWSEPQFSFAASFDERGALKWQRVWSSPHRFSLLAVDEGSDGSIVVAGAHREAAWFASLSANGAVAWQRQITTPRVSCGIGKTLEGHVGERESIRMSRFEPPPQAGRTTARAVATVDGDNVWVSGSMTQCNWTGSASPFDSDFFAVKITNAGALTDSVLFGSQLRESVSAVRTTVDGKLFVAGTMQHCKGDLQAWQQRPVGLLAQLGGERCKTRCSLLSRPCLKVEKLTLASSQKELIRVEPVEKAARSAPVKIIAKPVTLGLNNRCKP